MANIKSQIKRNRQNEKRRLRNKAVRNEMRTLVKSANDAIDAGDDDAAEKVDQAYRRIDTAVHKGVIHSNEAARRKSRLTKRLNA